MKIVNNNPIKTEFPPERRIIGKILMFQIKKYSFSFSGK